jgi:hypothetical protein
MPTFQITDRVAEKMRATEIYPNKGIYGFEGGKRVRAFVILLRNSGLCIRKTATLSQDKLHGTKLLLYTQKTGQPVWLPSPKLLRKNWKS